jgi:hypothetical protein
MQLVLLVVSVAVIRAACGLTQPLLSVAGRVLGGHRVLRLGVLLPAVMFGAVRAGLYCSTHAPAEHVHWRHIRMLVQPKSLCLMVSCLLKAGLERMLTL